MGIGSNNATASNNLRRSRSLLQTEHLSLKATEQSPVKLFRISVHVDKRSLADQRDHSHLEYLLTAPSKFLRRPGRLRQSNINPTWQTRCEFKSLTWQP